MEKNNVDTETVLLRRYLGEVGWEDITAFLIDENEFYAEYISTFSGLSLFAIVGEEVQTEKNLLLNLITIFAGVVILAITHVRIHHGKFMREDKEHEIVSKIWVCDVCDKVTRDKHVFFYLKTVGGMTLILLGIIMFL